MGITIFFDLECDSAEQATRALENVKQKALDLPIAKVGDVVYFDKELMGLSLAAARAKLCDPPASDKDREGYEGWFWAWIQSGIHHVVSEEPRRSGIKRPSEAYWLLVWVGPGCEPTNLILGRCEDGKWRGEAFTKTEYAWNRVFAHLMVCQVLEFAQEEGILKEARDKAEFWETRDVDHLIEEFDGSRAMIEGQNAVLQVAAEKEGVRFKTSRYPDQPEDFKYPLPGELPEGVRHTHKEIAEAIVAVANRLCKKKE